MQLFRGLIGLGLLYLVPGHAWMFAAGLATIVASSALWIPLLAGFVLGWLLWVVLLARIPGLATFEHELTHALVALVFLRTVTEFSVTRHHGGHVRWRGNFGGLFGDDMIGLAPYFLPTLTFVLALLYPLLAERFGVVLLVTMGATLAYHTFSTIDETRENWDGGIFTATSRNDSDVTDISKRGTLFSAITICSLTLWSHAVVWWCVAGGYGGVMGALAQAWTVSRAWWPAAAATIQGLIGRVIQSFA